MTITTTLRVAVALVIVAIVPAPALADSASGSGAAYDVKVGTESVSFLAASQGGQLTLHVRNVGTRPARVVVIPQCDAGSRCGSARSLSIKPVERDNDASQDATIAFPSSARTFSWTITA